MAKYTVSQSIESCVHYEASFSTDGVEYDVGWLGEHALTKPFQSRRAKVTRYHDANKLEASLQQNAYSKCKALNACKPKLKGRFNPVDVFCLPVVDTYRTQIDKPKDGEVKFRRHVPTEPYRSEFETYPKRRKTLRDNLMWIAQYKEEGLDAPFLGYMPCDEKRNFLDYEWLSYRETLDYAARLVSGIHRCGFAKTKKFDNTGYKLADRMKTMAVAMEIDHHWVILEIISQMLGICLIPIYSAWPAALIERIIEDTKCDTIFIDYCTFQKWSLMNWKRGDSRKTLVVCGRYNRYKPNVVSQDEKAYDFDNSNRLLKKKCFFEVIRVTELLKCEPFTGFLADESINDNEMWTVSYTSGTVSKHPKPCMLTYGNLRNVVWSMAEFQVRDPDFIAAFKKTSAAGNDPTYFSYIPTAHIFERTFMQSMALLGFKMAHGACPLSENKVLDEAKKAKVTNMILVPEVLVEINKEIMSQIMDASAKHGEKLLSVLMKSVDVQSKQFFNKGRAANAGAKKWLNPLDVGRNANELVLQQLKNEILPDLQMVICGGSPIQESLKLRCQAFLLTRIVNGYGLTETGAAVLIQHTSNTDNYMGHPMKTVEMKLIDHPTSGSRADKLQGELCVRGNVNCMGYFQDLQQTRKEFDAKQWFHTGDICSVDPIKGVRFLDRTQASFVLTRSIAGSKKKELVTIFPEEYEATWSLIHGIEQIFVTHDDSKTRLVTFIHLSQKALAKLYPGQNAKEINCTRTAQASIIVQIRAASRAHHKVLPRKFIFLDRPLRRDDKILTPSDKVRRALIRKMFVNVISYISIIDDNIVVRVDNAVRNKPIIDCILTHSGQTIIDDKEATDKDRAERHSGKLKAGYNKMDTMAWSMP